MSWNPHGLLTKHRMCRCIAPSSSSNDDTGLTLSPRNHVGLGYGPKIALRRRLLNRIPLLWDQLDTDRQKFPGGKPWDKSAKQRYKEIFWYSSLYQTTLCLTLCFFMSSANDLSAPRLEQQHARTENIKKKWLRDAVVRVGLPYARIQHCLNIASTLKLSKYNAHLNLQSPRIAFKKNSNFE